MGTVRLVGDRHVCIGCDAGLFPTTPIVVAKRSAIVSVPPSLQHPLIAHTKAAKGGWKHDPSLLITFVTFGKTGIASIDAMAALFLAWAHHQTLQSSKRTPWPGRTRQHTLQWARKQAWVQTGCGLGANGELTIARALGGGSIKAPVLLATAAPATRAFLLAALKLPAAYIVAMLPGGSATHFLAPELWLVAAKTVPYTQCPAGVRGV